MAFSSLLFLFGFLPVFLLVYYLAPARFKNFVALVASCLFYSWGAANVLLILVVGLVIDYAIGNAIAELEPTTQRAQRLRKLLLLASIVVNVGALGYFKYSNFFVAQLNIGLTACGLPNVGWPSVLLP